MAAADKARASENARLAALTRWSRVRDRSAATQAARDAQKAGWDPGPDVPEPQRSKMIAAAAEAHMIRMRRALADRRASAGHDAA